MHPSTPPSETAPGGRRPDPAGARAPGAGASWATGLALLFLFVTLLALALAPAYLSRDLREIQAQLREVMAPAEDAAADIEGAQEAQMAALEAFLTTGQGQARQRYRNAERAEQEAFQTLQRLVDSLPLRARTEAQEKLARTLTLSFSWHLGHQGALLEERSREAYLDRLEMERSLHRELLSASRELRRTLARETRRGLERMEAAGAVQARVTRGLAGLGILATLLVVLLGFRLRRMMAELETRRRDALRARREADALLEATGDGVLGVDRKGRCTFLNRAGAELLGYPTRMVVGKDLHDFLHHSREDGQTLPREA